MGRKMDDEIAALGTELAKVNCSSPSDGSPQSENQVLASLRSLFQREVWPVECTDQARELGLDAASLESLVKRHPGAGRVVTVGPSTSLAAMIVPPENAPEMPRPMRKSYRAWFKHRMKRDKQKDMWREHRKEFQKAILRKERRKRDKYKKKESKSRSRGRSRDRGSSIQERDALAMMVRQKQKRKRKKESKMEKKKVKQALKHVRKIQKKALHVPRVPALTGLKGVEDGWEMVLTP